MRPTGRTDAKPKTGGGVPAQRRRPARPGGAARAGGSHGHLRPGWGSVEAWAGGRADTRVRAAPRWLETAGVPAGRAGLRLGRAAIRRPGRWPGGSPARPSPVRPRRPPASVGAGPGVAV